MSSEVAVWEGAQLSQGCTLQVGRSMSFGRLPLCSILHTQASCYTARFNEGNLALKDLIRVLLCLLFISARASAQSEPQPQTADTVKQQSLWAKLESTISEVDHNLDGVLGVAIEDLATGQKFLLRADSVFPQASSIKIAVLAELYHQNQQAMHGTAGKAKLTDLYTVQSVDLVSDSDIMGGLTPGVTRITNRDLATMMVAVSDNSATNVLIDRVGMDNVNTLLDSLALRNTRLRRKMMDVKAASEGRENISTPQEMMTLLEKIYKSEVLDKESTTGFFKMLSTHKNGFLTRDLPDGLQVANKPGELEAVRNDSGIVFLQSRPYIICVMTTYLARERDGEEGIAKISAAAFAMFDRFARSSEYGRVISVRNSAPK
jgi:beta-lactamase class A